MTLRTPFPNDAKSYGFEWLRVLLESAGVQEGVLNGGDFKVTPGTGGGMNVDVAAGTALVKGDSGVPGAGLSQGLFIEVNDAAIANALALDASHATLPRIDQIVVRVRDSSDLGSGADDAVLEKLTGVATAGATLDNRTGAAALPGDRLRLADILVPAASAAVTAGNVRDRRQWARGANRRIVRNANAAAGIDYTTTSSTMALIDSANLNPRIECSGVPLQVILTSRATHSLAAGWVGWEPFLDGAPAADGMTTAERLQIVSAAAAGSEFNLGATYIFPPAAGSHVVGPAVAASAATGTIRARAAIPLLWSVRELVRQDADNS